MPRDRRARIADILEAIARIETYVANQTFEEFAADSKTFDAVIRNFEVIGEADNSARPARPSRGVDDAAWVPAVGSLNRKWGQAAAKGQDMSFDALITPQS